jgi:uncharacterized DUF497 family protein
VKHGREIEFDPAKDELNGKFHRIHLSTVALVFADPYRVELLDESEGNMPRAERIQIVGKVGKVLFVACAERKKTG